MSLTLSLHNALTALQTTQSALRVTSNNVANANTEGYTRKVAAPISNMVLGQSQGVTLSGIEREVDQNMLRSIRAEMSQVGRFEVRDRFFERMQQMFGSLSSDSALSDGINKFAAKLEALAAFPEDASARLEVVQAAVALTNQITGAAREIQTMRAEADQEIATSVDSLNAELRKIADINSQINRLRPLGEPTADLEDLRDQAVEKVAGFLDISTFERDTGELTVMTKSGRQLVSGAQAFTLSHTPASNADLSTTYPGGFDGITLNGADITPEIGLGKLGALVEMRDTELLNLANEIETLSVQLRDQVNAIHNDGVAFPPPETLTGTRAVAGADPVAGTGNVRITVTNPAGDVVNTVDLDLTTVASVADVEAAIDAALGPDADADISGGTLAIDGAGSNRIAINELDSDIGGRGFSHYFGLNDFFTGDASVSLSSAIAVRPDIRSNPDLLSRGELATGALAVGDTAVTAGGNSVVQRLASVFNSQVSFSASGGQPATTDTLAGYASNVVSRNSVLANEATQNLQFRESLLADLQFRADSASGVNVDEEMANLLVLQNAFAASSRVVSATSEMLDLLTNLGR